MFQDKMNMKYSESTEKKKQIQLKTFKHKKQLSEGFGRVLLLFSEGFWGYLEMCKGYVKVV